MFILYLKLDIYMHIQLFLNETYVYKIYTSMCQSVKFRAEFEGFFLVQPYVLYRLFT